MSARISKMYKDSGGCKVGKTCGECRYYSNSGIKNEYVCKRQVSDDLWDGKWPACKFFEDRGDEPMEIIKKDEITIDPEFSSIIPPLTKEEYDGLEKSILEEGCRESLIVWNGILIDGHNRYEICRKHNKPYSIMSKDFSSRADAVSWMVQNQLSRRNLPDYVKVTLGLKAEEAIAQEAEKNKHKATGGDRRSKAFQLSQKSDQVEQSTEPTATSSQKPDKTEKQIKQAQHNENRTASKVAKIAGVSRDTVYKVKEIEKKATPKTKELLRSNQISINQAYNSVHPKKPKVDIVAEAKKEHEEFQQKKAEHTVSFKEVQEDKNNQRIVNDALLKDIVKLFNAISDFGSKYKNEELQNLSASIKEKERPKYVQQCDLCQRILETIRKSL